jgi:hypothetical protein
MVVVCMLSVGLDLRHFFVCSCRVVIVDNTRFANIFVVVFPIMLVLCLLLFLGQ